MSRELTQKSKRQGKILDLIAHYDIETQDELTEWLRREGYSVTQATVSRDVRELKIVKVTASHGKYKYATSVPSSEYTEPSDFIVKLGKSLSESILSADCAENIVVIKTSPGMASAVATGIDTISVDTILGCVAGDDCIIVVARTSTDAAEICVDIRGMIK